MAGGGGTSGGRVLLGAEPPGSGVEILSTVAELGQGHALIWKGLGEGGQDTVSPRAQWMQLRVDGQAEHVVTSSSSEGSSLRAHVRTEFSADS